MRVRCRILVTGDQDLRHIRRSQPPKTQPLASGSDRRQQRIGGIGDEDERGRVRRLLERLEDGVLRVDTHLLRLVDDDDAAAAFEGTVSRALDRLADLLDLDGAGLAGFDAEDVRVDAADDAAA